ncbi:MAG TPA: hypothetical protein VE008_11445 [Burkholderiales bacterium]|nr:hypothetical protein [Burkholderiales bacterium]
MKNIFASATAVSLLGFAFAAAAQDRAVVTVAQTEAVVKVVNLDRQARTVTIQGTKGNLVTLKVPKESQNFDQVKIGSTFKVKFVEAVAVALQRGGMASASASQTVRLAPKGGTPGGVVVSTAQISATVEAIDYASREVAVKGPRGNILAFRVADNIQGFSDIDIGDSITLVYTEAMAMEMLPSGPKAKPTPKKD